MMLHVIYVIIDTCEQARCARPIFQNAGQTGSDMLSQEVLWSFKDSTVNRKKRIEFQVNAELLCFMDSRAIPCVSKTALHGQCGESSTSRVSEAVHEFALCESIS